jgi:lysophospholipase L1-like esterase
MSSLVYIISITASTAHAITAKDLGDVLNGFTNYNSSEGALACGTGASASAGLAPGSKIYVLGDSITNIAKSDLSADITAADFAVASINADGGRAISTDTSPPGTSGLEAVSADNTTIATADAVVVALGTNSGVENLDEQIPVLIEAIRQARQGTTVPIFWVNVFSGSNVTGKNEQIASNGAEDKSNYHIIDTTSAGIEIDTNDPQRVHPSAAGAKTFAKTIVDALVAAKTGGPPSANSSITFGSGVWGEGSEIYQSTIQPPYDIEQWAISVLKNISKKSGIVESRMVTQEKVLALVAWANAEGGGVNGHNGDFNPLNTKLGHDDLDGANQGDASNDSNSNGFPTFDKGVEASTRAMFTRTQSRIGTAILSDSFKAEDFIQVIAGDFYSTTGKNWINRLEDQYPGNAAWATLSITGYNYGGGIGDRAKYIKAMLGSVQDVRNNYAKYAQRLLNGSTGAPPALVFNGSGATGETLGFDGCASDTAGIPATGKASEYIADCAANEGNAAIACVAINQLMGIPYSQAGRAIPTDPNPRFLDCSAFTSMAVYRTFGNNLGSMCSTDYLSNKNFQVIDVHDIKTGDFVGKGTGCATSGGGGHIGVVVSYDPATKKLITVEASSEKYLSGLRGIGGPGGYNVGLAADGNGTFTWAVRYIGPKTLQAGALTQ